MSFQNSYGPDGSININVVPSFGRIIQLPEQQKYTTVFNLLPRLLKLKHGERKKEPFEADQLISILAGTFPSALNKLLSSQLPKTTFTSTLKDLDSAEDLDFDSYNSLFKTLFICHNLIDTKLSK